jgi:hypothetical protein
MRHSWGITVVYRVLLWRPDGKRPLVRPGCRWDYNIKMGLHEIIWTGLIWLRTGVGSGLLLMWE